MLDSAPAMPHDVSNTRGRTAPLGVPALALPLAPLLPVLAAVQEGGPDGGAPAWMVEARFWLAVALFVAVVVAASGVWALVVHVRQLRDLARRVERLDDLDLKLGRLVAERDDLDLRRLEHVLIDMREGQRRLEEALLRSAERSLAPGASASSTELVASPSAEAVGERVVNRLLVMGYDEVQVITRAEKLLELMHKDGEVLVEARRDGVLYKGRVLLRGGRLSDVELNPAYSIFP